MSEHQHDHHAEPHDHDHAHRAPRVVERQCDVLVVGGSAAGLAAALQLGRQRRTVIVVDAGEPRNAPAAHMHSYLGYEGQSPSALVAAGKEEVRSYGGEVIRGRVTGVTRTDDGRFRADVVGGNAIVARRIVVATGVVDVLPDVEGLADHWGREVVHCPFCHGFEFRDQRIVQIVTSPLALHATPLWRQLTADLTLVLQDGVDPAIVDEGLVAAGVQVVTSPARRVVTDDGRLTGVVLADGRVLPADAVTVATTVTARIEPFAGIGLEVSEHPRGMGEHIVVDMTGATAVPGVYAVGNVAEPALQVLASAAEGTKTGAMVSFDLAADDVAGSERSTGNQADWDHRYSGDLMWSGNPNGTLVNQVADLTPGRALDVGAGEGGDVRWLAEHGWTVTASDVSQRAVDRIAALAASHDLGIESVRIDANDREAFTTSGFDLVSAQYASIPRTPDGRAVHNLLDAVAPGGVLLVVGHDLEPMRTPTDISTGTRMFDPDAYVRVDDVVAVLTDRPGWEIEVHERVPRPAGAASASHHVDDVVLRARRTS